MEKYIFISGYGPLHKEKDGVFVSKDYHLYYDNIIEVITFLDTHRDFTGVILIKHMFNFNSLSLHILCDRNFHTNEDFITNNYQDYISIEQAIHLLTYINNYSGEIE